MNKSNMSSSLANCSPAEGKTLSPDLEYAWSQIASLLEQIKTHVTEKFCLQEQLNHERKLRKQFEDGEDIVRLVKQEAAAQAKSDNARISFLEKQLAEAQRLRQEDREAFNNKESEMSSQLREAKDREEAMERELAEVKVHRDRADFNNKESEMSSQLKEAKDRENALQRELAEVKALRDKDRADFNKKESEMSSRLRKAKDVEKSLQRELAQVKALREKDRDDFNKEEVANTINLVKRYDSKYKELSEQIKKMELEKKTLSEHAQSQLDASQAEKEDLVRKIEILEQTVEQNKTAHENASADLASERAMLVRNASEQHIFINRHIQKHNREKADFLNKITKMEDVHSKETQELTTKLKKMEEQLKITDELNISLTQELAEAKKCMSSKDAEVEALMVNVSSMCGLQNGLKHEINSLSSQLSEQKAEKQNISNQFSDLGEKFRALEVNLVSQNEQKVEMDKEIETLQKHIRNMEKNAVLEFQRWRDEKHTIIAKFQQKVEACEIDKKALMKKYEELEVTAKQDKASLVGARILAEAMENGFYALKTTLLKKEGELKFQQDMIGALEQELERKRRRWYQKIFHS